jgi:hypothetical protein
MPAETITGIENMKNQRNHKKGKLLSSVFYDSDDNGPKNLARLFTVLSLIVGVVMYYGGHLFDKAHVNVNLIDDKGQ